jgi:Zn-dependent peptidase ImmA (M78 family)
MGTRYDPWRDAERRHPHVQVERCDTAPVDGAWIPSELVILIGDHLDETGRRCTLAHELAHIDLDHSPTGHHWFDRRAERDADVLAACRLIRLNELADALVEHALHPARVAHRLRVSMRILTARLATLREAEKRYISRRIAAREHAA